jgi:hypothetical protein
VKVCIAGLAESSRDELPWGREGWEFWGLGWDREWHRFDRVFEIHQMAMLTDLSEPLGDYLVKLALCPVVYMDEANPDVPGSVRYPFEAVAQTCGAYWESSIAYLVALAIHEGASEIAVYGVDMDAGEEYGYQKPNMEYLLGLAKGRGIKVFLPESSPLLKHSGQFGHIGRYGRVS